MKNNWKEISLGDMAKKTKAFFILTSNILWLIFIGIVVYASFVYILKNITVDVASVVLKYLKVLVWPIVVLNVIYAFKKNIARLIERIEEGEVSGVGTFKATQQLMDQTENPSETTKIQKDVESDKHYKDLFTEKEREIGALKDNQEQLVNKLAQAEIELEFEKIYNLIFASQIDLLKNINNFERVSLEYAIAYFETLQKVNTPVFDQWDVNKYLSYLSATDLINRDATHFNITQKGKVFLMYLTIQNYKKNGI